MNPKGMIAYNNLLMNLIDEQFTKTPFYGVLRITESLKLQGYQVNQKRIRRLMRKMGLEAIYPKPRLSSPGPDHKIYPYLLKGVRVENQIMSGVPISPISGWFVVLFIWL